MQKMQKTIVLFSHILYNIYVLRIARAERMHWMYKLLLVTDNPDVRDAYDRIDSWEMLGFHQPRIAGSVEEALASLTRHHADGIALNLPDSHWSEMMEALNAYPMLPVIRAYDDTGKDLENIRELGMLLNRTRADYSNDPYNAALMLQLRRHEYFRSLLAGREVDPEQVLSRLLMFRSKMDPHRPCMVLELETPSHDHYLEGRWHYGADRLEVAMRNIFGAELKGMRVLISVIDEEKIFLVACPMLGCKAPEGEDMEKLVLEHTRANIDHVREYLDIELRIASIVRLNTLLELTKGGAAALCKEI